MSTASDHSFTPLSRVRAACRRKGDSDRTELSCSYVLQDGQAGRQSPRDTIA